LAKYAQDNNIKLHIIDTSQNSFPIPTLKIRIDKAWNRILKLKHIIKINNINGVIIFSSTGFSFYEKVFMSFIANIYKVESFLFIRSGHFIDLNKKSKIIKSFNKFLLKIPTFLGAQGEKWVEFYDEMGINRSNIKLIHNWIEINKDYKYQTNEDKVVFLFAGWMVEKKGVLDLFNVIENNDDLKQFTFRFAGAGTLLEELKKRKEENNLDNIELLGWKDEKELQDEYEKADVFILPSYAEGFPNVVLEALNNRMPIISTNIGGIPDSVIDGYNGYIVEVGDKKVLYKSIKNLGESKDLRIKFSKNTEQILYKQHDLLLNCYKVFDNFEKLKDK
jgi:glycosyltransferase involved in cell wall biosynthesis